MSVKPTVLFVCVHNAGRSQMAAGFLRELGGEKLVGPGQELAPGTFWAKVSY